MSTISMSSQLCSQDTPKALAEIHIRLITSAVVMLWHPTMQR